MKYCPEGYVLIRVMLNKFKIYLATARSQELNRHHNDGQSDEYDLSRMTTSQGGLKYEVVSHQR